MNMGLSVSAILISCISAIAIAGCATASSPKDTREIRLNNALLAKDVTNRLTDSIPTDETSVFSQEDEQALMWVKLDQVGGRHTLRWEWYDPKGKLYLTTGDYKVNTDGKYRPYNTSWHKMAIKGEKAANLPGKWQVNILLVQEKEIRLFAYYCILQMQCCRLHECKQFEQDTHHHSRQRRLLYGPLPALIY